MINCKIKKEAMAKLPTHIFRAYDIRGLAETELTNDNVYAIGYAIGQQTKIKNSKPIAVGHDGRLSCPRISSALIKGLRATGCDVIDIGMVPTPVLYFATHHFLIGNGVMITGSHNPAEYNGFKIMLNGQTLSGDTIHDIRKYITKNNTLPSTSYRGSIEKIDIIPKYIEKVCAYVSTTAKPSQLKIVVDCGNGVASIIAPEVFRRLGHHVIELFCEVDGSFPNHHPDPSQDKNLLDLKKAVLNAKADLGFAFDGDGDRLGVIDGTGKIIWPDRQLMLMAGDVLSRHANAPIIFDVKCSRHLAQFITEKGGKPIMWKTGHSLIKQKMQELNSPLAGEFSGHIFFAERWYGFDDAIYAAVRLIELLLKSPKTPTQIFASLPFSFSSPELRIPLQESKHPKVMAKLYENLPRISSQNIISIDGLRIELSDAWGLIRPSNTSPYLVVRFEANSEQALESIKTAFRNWIEKTQPGLLLPF